MAVWYASKNPGSWIAGKKFDINLPCLTVMAAGMGGGFDRSLGNLERRKT